jgi:hypothetical protein
MCVIPLLYVLLKGSILKKVALEFFDLDFGTAIIGFVLISYGSTWAGLFALGQGILVDLFSVGPVGLFSLLYLAAFLTMLGGCRLFDLHSPKGQVILISTAVCLKGVLLLLFLLVFSFEVRSYSLVLILFGASALLTGILSPLFFHFLYFLKRLLIEGSHET